MDLNEIRKEWKFKFIEAAKKKYGDQFDYSLMDYKNARTEVYIYDRVHDKGFYRPPCLHLKYNDKNYAIKDVKPSGYWHSKENCYKASLECSNKFEFMKKYRGGYTISRKNGWLEEFFKDRPSMINYHALDEPIHCVYVYEITEYNTCYVGRTLNLKRRDYQHRNPYKYRKRKHAKDAIKITILKFHNQ